MYNLFPEKNSCADTSFIGLHSMSPDLSGAQASEGNGNVKAGITSYRPRHESAGVRADFT